MKASRNLIQICLLCALTLQALTSGAQPVTQIAAGISHSLFLKSGGSLWAMGNNTYGGLGDGTYNNTNLPELIVASNVTAIAAGAGHSLFLKILMINHLNSNGSLSTMGANWAGQLGDGTYSNADRPEIILVTNVIMIAAGSGHSLFLKGDGSLWAMGNNSLGQLGIGTFSVYAPGGTNWPQLIVASNVMSIAAGSDFSLFIKSDGSLWGMGDDEFGELGDGTGGDKNRPEQIIASNVTASAGGYRHSLFLKNDGSLWAMGDNSLGQLGDGTTDNGNYITKLPEQIVASNVTAIAAGDNHSLFLKRNGSLWDMGWNVYGQLGDGTTNDAKIPELIVASNVTAIAGGSGFSLFLKSDGSLWAMGYNRFGQLGDGRNSNTNRPEQILGPYNQIQTTSQLMGGTNMQLSFVGVANANYALDWSGSLSPPNWIPQATNPASSFGPLVFTNAPVLATNNFWRIRSVP